MKKNVFGLILILLFSILYSYGLASLVTWLLSLAFGFKFTWLRALAVWTVTALLSGGWFNFTVRK